MKQTPLLCTAPMVRAKLAGEKTQTRRLLKGDPPEHTIQISTWHHPDPRPHFYAWTARPGETAEISTWCTPCPYGAPGDLLWVREAWRVAKQHDDKPPRDLAPRKMTVFFEAGGSIANQRSGRWEEDRNYSAIGEAFSWVGKLRPSMFMPRWACRLEHTLTSVTAQRLQEITDADAYAEGINEWLRSLYADPGVATDDIGALVRCYGTGPRAVYAALWDWINGRTGPDSWEANPYVWRLSWAKP